mgnify:CR=1 FL=1
MTFCKKLEVPAKKKKKKVQLVFRIFFFSLNIEKYIDDR